MSKKVLKLAGQRPMLVALIMATLTLGLLFSGWLTPTPGRAQQNSPTNSPPPSVESTNCDISSVTTNCISAGSVSLITHTNRPIVCLGNPVTISVGITNIYGQIQVVTTYSNCPTTTVTNPTTPSYGVTWTANVGSFSASGIGPTATFTPTDCGDGTVGFTLNYTNDPACGGTGASSSSGVFKVLSLNIAGGGGIISSANGNDVAIVGQHINLTAQTCGGTFSNFQWSVPGYAISNYDISNGKLYTSFPTTNSSVSFYWVDGGSKQVSCSAVCAGVTCSTNVTFTVVRPTAQIKPWTTSVNVNGNILIFSGNGKDGITFSNSIAIPTGFSGSSVWAQIVTSADRSLKDNTGVNHIWTEIGASPYGDLPTPYQASDGVNYVDSPSIGLPSGYVTGSASDHFEMWMMFQPSGGICVPLRAVNWYWSGSATNIAGTWTLQGGATSSVNPTDFDTTTFPTWNSAVSNGHYVP